MWQNVRGSPRATRASDSLFATTTMKLGLCVLPGLLGLLAVEARQSLDYLRVLGPQGVNLWKLEKAAAAAAAGPKFMVQDGSGFHMDAEDNVAGFKAQWFRQPVDHFDKNSNATFRQRYWVNTRHYNPEKGGPVIVLDGGETSGVVRVFIGAEPLPEAFVESPFVLRHRFALFATSAQPARLNLCLGIVEILTRNTGGVGVVLEHRYYGTWRR